MAKYPNRFRRLISCFLDCYYTISDIC